MPLACLYGRCLGGNLCQIYSSRGDSGPMTFQITRHYMRTLIAAYPKTSTLIEPSYRLITGMNLIGCLHLCLFGAHFFNSTRDGSSVPMVRDA